MEESFGLGKKSYDTETDTIGFGRTLLQTMLLELIVILVYFITLCHG